MRYILFFVINSLISTSLMAKWFDGYDAITSAHQHLLEGETAESFLSMVEAWQQNNTGNEQRNLIKLLSLAISEDCGRSLSKDPLPSWLKKLVIRRESVQTSNQVYYEFSIYGRTEEGLSDLSLLSWSEQVIQLKKSSDRDGYNFKYGIEGLSENISSGLYKLNITSIKGEIWSSWILINSENSIQKISWHDSKSWKIAPILNLKSTCPKPIISMDLYKQNSIGQTKVWSLKQDNHFSTSLPMIDISPGEYWFSVGLIENRWQGPVLFEEIQSIGGIVTFPNIEEN